MHTKLEGFVSAFRVAPGSKISLSEDFYPDFKPEGLDKESARERLSEGIAKLAELQDRLYAQDLWSVLLIFQARDAAGKDSTIKHVMSGINPQGCSVTSFKVPSAEEMDHDYLWRSAKALPERGRIGIFNRSHYEEVLVVRVHPQILARQQLPETLKGEDIWEKRYHQINQFEQHLSENGTLILKFFLNVSKEEQKKRFLERIEKPEKNWKFSAADLKERALWEQYDHAYEAMLEKTSTPHAPWHVIPADRKWVTHLAVAEIILQSLNNLNLEYPQISEEQKLALADCKRQLDRE